VSAITDEAIRALVPCTSKCCGHKGSHHGLEVCCLLKTSRVCALVPRTARLNTITRPVRAVCARLRGAGLTFMMAVCDYALVVRAKLWYGVVVKATTTLWNTEHWT
jgi:hypothetical protein